MNKLRMGLIGAGNIAQSAHLPAYAKLDDVEVVAIADWNLERAKSAAARFGIPHAYASVEELLAAEDIDAVDICVWNRSHSDVAIAAAKAGKHVLCEKPLASSLDNAYALEKAVKEAGVTFMLAVPRRYQNDVQLLAGMVSRGELGEVYYGKTAMIRRRGTPVGWFTDTRKSGGGPALDIGVHCIDCCWYLMGRPKPVSVSACTHYHIGDYKTRGVSRWVALDSDVTAFDTEDSAAGVIRFDNNACMLFETSWAINAPNQEYTQICGSKAGATLGPLTIYGEENEHLVDKRPTTIDVDRFEREIAHFAACVREKKTPLSSLEDAVTLQKMLEAIYLSARTGKEVQLSSL